MEALTTRPARTAEPSRHRCRGCHGGDGRLLGHEPTEEALRSGLEQCYRALARLAPDQAQRIDLVDRANEVRPRTWL